MNYYHLKGGLHSAEIRLIQRALREHLQTATAHKADLLALQKMRDPDVKAFEITQAQDAIDALVRLSNRLRRELEPVGDAVEANKQETDRTLKRRLAKHAKQYFNT